MMIRIGPSGTSGLGYNDGIADISRLNLSAMEVAFTHGVNMNEPAAKALGKRAQKNGISLSIHAPYYINLAAKEKEKQDASKQRVMMSCARGEAMGAKYVVFHAGFYQKMDADTVYDMIRDNITEIMDAIRSEGWKVKIAPEVTGKKSQFSGIKDLLKLKEDTGCHITIDFAHQKARNNGKIDYVEVFDMISSLKHIHSHFSGIEWTEKGEKRHVLTKKEDIIPLAEEILNRKSNITIINESPDPIGDASKMKKVFEELGHKF